MSKRARGIPAPQWRLLPSVIRSFGPRVILLGAGCAALLVFGGGSYILSHLNPVTKAVSPKRPLHTAVAPVDQAQVLAGSTASVGDTPSTATSPASDQTSPTTTTRGSAVSFPTTPASQPGSAAEVQAGAVGTDVQASTNQGSTDVKVQTPVGGLSLQLPLGL